MPSVKHYALTMPGAFEEAKSELVGKAVVLTDGKAGTVENVWLDELHGLRVSIRGHVGKWPVNGFPACHHSDIAYDLGCVKTRTSRECAELSSQFPSSDRRCQCNWFLHRRNREGSSTRKSSVRVFTQPRPISEVALFDERSLPGRKILGRKKHLWHPVRGRRSCATVVPFDQQPIGKVNALSHLGNLHCGVRRRIVRQ